MADEENITDADAVNAADETPPAKKTRQPRKPRDKADGDVPGDTTVSVKPVKKPRAKRNSKTASAKVTKSPSSSAVGENASIASAAEQVMAPATHSDEFADLMKLEEENKSLRKQLSEKLRAENADLRKRLGQP